ncbi:MAG: hypothetical protein D6732_00845 [Methanobacteriota archaeon]|nr:MAG: hypothetical protein D6732_00845 [Euryarchaeota archaeon]
MSATTDIKKGRTLLNELREKRKALINEVREYEAKRAEYREKRTEYNTKAREAFFAAQKEREERDKINEEVKLEKALRDMSKEDAQKALAELEALEKEMEEKGISPRKGGRGQTKRIMERINKLELEMETKPDLTVEEEREYIKELEDLYAKLETLTSATELKGEMRAIQQRLKMHRNNARAHHKKVTKLAEKSQEHHDRMIQLLKESNEYKALADEQHKLVQEMYDKIREIRAEINRVTKEADAIRKELGEKTSKEKKKEQQDLKKKIEEENKLKATLVKEKYEAGERLGFEEFKMLINHGLLKEEKD